MKGAANRAFNAVDRGMVHLVRLVLSDDWSIAGAAAELSRRIDDPRIRRHMAARIERARAERPSEIATRAALTLQAAARISGNGTEDRRRVDRRPQWDLAH